MSHKSLWVCLTVIIFLSVLSHYLDFGHGLTWLGFSEPQDFVLLLLRLLFLSLIVERVVELYVIGYRAPQRVALDQAIETEKTEGKDYAKTQLEEYKAETARKAAFVGFSLGVVMALAGIRVFTGMFEFGDASSIQIVLFDVLEIFIMGALMASGSKGINTIVSAIEGFARKK